MTLLVKGLFLANCLANTVEISNFRSSVNGSAANDEATIGISIDAERVWPVDGSVEVLCEL